MEKDIFVELNFLIMIIDDALPKFDLPVDFVTDDSITGDILNQYGRFPCHIKAGVFVLCTRGTVRATINLSEYTITHNDFVTVLPGSFIQIHEVSSDTRVCFAGFSSEFISRVSYVDLSGFSPYDFGQSYYGITGRGSAIIPKRFQPAYPCLFFTEHTG